MSRWTYSRIENGARTSTTIDELAQVCAALGLDLSIRAFPGGEPLRDAAQVRRLATLLDAAGSPLTARTEVPLPRSIDHPDLRAWDAVLFGGGKRTGIEMEMRIHDGQELERRFTLKCRDDPVDFALLAIADTVHNRRVLAENSRLFAGLPRLRRALILRVRRAGRHPPSGLVIV